MNLISIERIGKRMNDWGNVVVTIKEDLASDENHLKTVFCNSKAKLRKK